LCEGGRTVDFAEVAVVGVGVLVDIAQQGSVALRVVGEGCHRLVLILVICSPATRDVGSSLASGSHDCGVWIAAEVGGAIESAWGGRGSARVRRSDDTAAEKVRVQETSNVGSAGGAGPEVAAIRVVMGRGRVYGRRARVVR
jgi:hypothetical protein